MCVTESRLRRGVRGLIAILMKTSTCRLQTYLVHVETLDRFLLENEHCCMYLVLRIYNFPRTACQPGIEAHDSCLFFKASSTDCLVGVSMVQEKVHLMCS